MASVNFVKGSLKGRVGQFIGSSWKGIDYIKTYTPPRNPRTEGQVAIRTIFQHCAHLGKAINEGVLKPYTFPRPVKMTAYNRMIQINKELFNALAWDQAKLKIFEGSLFNPGITAAVIEGSGTSAVAVKVTFANTTGDGTDKAIAVIHDEATETTLYAVSDRAAGEVDIPIGTIDQADLSLLHAYLVFSRPPAHGTGETGEVSSTAYLKVPGPTP
ncbi:MAG: DUF6266 family protein [Spirochaetaceae bacterium]|jgi:hypothetical protein|nr:DUF6266 family protein [Spirochaetaceae bacterium]